MAVLIAVYRKARTQGLLSKLKLQDTDLIHARFRQILCSQQSLTQLDW